MADISAVKKRRHTASEKMRMRRQAQKNARFRSKPIKIARQPRKQRSRYVGYVVFIWENGPKKGKKYNTQVTLRGPARIKIQGRDLVIIPRDGQKYIWGDDNPNPQPSEKKQKDFQSKKRNPSAKRELRLREAIQAKFDAFMEERGAHGAGKAMARCFVIGHNRLSRKVAKLALAKVYGSVLKRNKAAHLAFSRAVRRSVSLKKTVDQDKKKAAMTKVAV